MDKALSGRDILNALNNQARIITYKDIYKYNTLTDLLGKYKTCIILYERRKDFGHWTCIFEHNPNCISFFDSLGVFIDEELNFCKPYYNAIQPYLSKLIRESRYKNIEYNEYVLQKTAPQINTCGRHVICRIWNRHLTLYNYIKYLLQYGYNTDMTVYNFTQHI